MIFCVQYNYGGIPVKSDEAMNDKSQVDIISSWNIAEYLPKKVQVSYLVKSPRKVSLHLKINVLYLKSKSSNLIQELFCVLHVFVVHIMAIYRTILFSSFLNSCIFPGIMHKTKHKSGPHFRMVTPVLHQ